ncbi:hypothetical protein DID88_009986 [Monilinia fructigena]|uniref:Uncharacterized protein n=1 Tax=Monilinia fructigena TaxID=38457 RepID=A0A395IM98_9HELO|nr:hypothetical protein DID88_009986 [Monilinia fructigena]
MAPTKKIKPEMSAFERRRLENIAANQSNVERPEYDSTKNCTKTAPKPKSSTPRKKTAPIKKETSRPTRISSRLAGIEADSETAKRKAEVELDFAKEVSQAKRQRVAGDLNISDIVVEGKNGRKKKDFIWYYAWCSTQLRTFTEDEYKRDNR